MLSLDRDFGAYFFGLVEAPGLSTSFSNLDWTWPDCSLFSLYFRGINRQVQVRLEKITEYRNKVPGVSISPPHKKIK
jgi:hypothetical protein